MPVVILSALILAAYAALPAVWGLRAWAATGGLVIWAYGLTPETPWNDQGWLYGAGAGLALLLFVLATCAVGARAAWAVWRGQPLHLTGASDGPLRRTDVLLALLLGLMIGLVATLVLASALRGAPGGLVLHLGITGLAFIAAALAVRLPLLRLRTLAISVLTTMACLVLLGGTLYPRLILSKAEVIKPDAARCLRTPDGTAPTTDQLRLLTLPEARYRRPNLVLTVMTDRGPTDFRWSYRSFAFRTYDSYDGGPCPT